MYFDSTVVYNQSQEGIAQNIYIYKLTRSLDSTTLFNTSLTAADYDPTPISVGSPIFFGDDSLKIYLSEDYGKELLKTTPAEFDSLSLFVERVKGLYITTDTPDLVAEGGRLNYLNLGESYIYLNYYLTDPERDFNRFDTTETFMVGYGFAVNSLRTSSDALANDTPGDKLYIESMSGIKPKINGDKLKKILTEWMEENGYNNKNVLISRASLDFPYEADYSDYDILDNQYPSNIFPCYKYASPDSLQSYRPLEEIYSNTSIGQINRSLLKYTCDITDYVQSLIKKDAAKITSEDDLYISPVYSYTDSSSNTYYAFDCDNYRKAILNGPTSERKPTLTLTFAILNE